MQPKPKDKPARPRRLAWIAAALAVGAVTVRVTLSSYRTTAWVLLGVAAFLLLWFWLCPLPAARVVLGGLAAVVAAALVTAEIPVLSASRGDAAAEAPYLVVLGAGVNGTTPSRSLQDRLVAARDYLQAHPATVAIVSGGQGAGEDISEAQAMQDWLVANGIAPERIVQEDRSTSTQENLTNSFALIEARGDAPADGVAIVSSEYHLYRAKCKAQRLGATVYGVAGQTGIPSLRANYFLREAFAVWYMWLFE